MTGNQFWWHNFINSDKVKVWSDHNLSYTATAWIM
jgi:hypothetical protein